MTDIDLQGRRFNVPLTDPAGVVNSETVFCFSQDGASVTASYCGGRIRQGYLVGILEGRTLRFRFCQAQTDGRLDGGESSCTIEHVDDGRLRIIERFQWESRPGETGENVFEELLNAAR